MEKCLPTQNSEAPKEISSLSYSATVTASSEYAEKQEYAKNIADGVVLGDGIFKNRYDAYMQDPTRTNNDSQNIPNRQLEWATLWETGGAWVQLSWANPVTANRIILYDRPDLDENMVKGKLTFSDGSSLDVGMLNKNGSATVIDFHPKTFKWVKLTIINVEGSCSGLAEFEVYKQP